MTGNQRRLLGIDLGKDFAAYFYAAMGYVAAKRKQHVFKGHVQCAWSSGPLDTYYFLTFPINLYPLMLRNNAR